MEKEKKGRHKRHTTAVWFDTRTHVRKRPISEKKKKKSYNENVTPSAASIYPSWISRKNTTKFKFVCVFLGRGCEKFPFSLVSLFIPRNAVRSIQILFHLKIKYLQKKNLFVLFSRGDHEARKWWVRNGRV